MSGSDKKTLNTIDYIYSKIIKAGTFKVDKIEGQDFFKDNNTLIKEADILFNSFLSIPLSLLHLLTIKFIGSFSYLSL